MRLALPVRLALMPVRPALAYGERNRLHLLRAWSDHNQELAGFDHALHVDVPKCQAIRGDRQRHHFTFPWLQRHTLERFEFLYGPRHRADDVANVKLHGFIRRSASLD